MMVFQNGDVFTNICLLAISHQVHCHGFNNFKEILTKFFRFLQSFVFIGHNDFNRSSGFQAHCDNMRKSTEKKKCYKCYTWGTYCPGSKKYLAGQVPLSLSTIMKQTEGCDEPKEGEEDKISQHTILILKHADFVSEWWKLCF